MRTNKASRLQNGNKTFLKHYTPKWIWAFSTKPNSTNNLFNVTHDIKRITSFQLPPTEGPYKQMSVGTTELDFWRLALDWENFATHR